MGGLHPERIYEIETVDFAADTVPTRIPVVGRQGAALMEEGLAWPLRDPLTARIWVLQSEY